MAALLRQVEELMASIARPEIEDDALLLAMACRRTRFGHALVATRRQIGLLTEIAASDFSYRAIFGRYVLTTAQKINLELSDLFEWFTPVNGPVHQVAWD